jgi:hypothetical protein
MFDSEAAVAVFPVETDREPGSTPYRQSRCRHISPKGARCRLSQISTLGFCRKHGSEALALESAEGKRLAKELMGGAKNSKTAVALHQFVGKALVAFAERRISPREAEAISRLAHIFLLSLDRVAGEYSAAGGWIAWGKMVNANIPPDALPPGLDDYYKKLHAECAESWRRHVAPTNSPRESHIFAPADTGVQRSVPHPGDRG